MCSSGASPSYVNAVKLTLPEIVDRKYASLKLVNTTGIVKSVIDPRGKLYQLLSVGKRYG